jgi:hypothetical protein
MLPKSDVQLSSVCLSSETSYVRGGDFKSSQKCNLQLRNSVVSCLFYFAKYFFIYFHETVHFSVTVQ